MPAYKLSRDAVSNIEALTGYSLEIFGEARTTRYVDAIKACLNLLAENPKMGRDLSAIRAGLRRHEHQSLVTYYRPDGEDILILRLLGIGQDPARHL